MSSRHASLNLMNVVNELASSHCCDRDPSVKTLDNFAVNSWQTMAGR